MPWQYFPWAVSSSKYLEMEKLSQKVVLVYKWSGPTAFQMNKLDWIQQRTKLNLKLERLCVFCWFFHRLFLWLYRAACFFPWHTKWHQLISKSFFKGGSEFMNAPCMNFSKSLLLTREVHHDQQLTEHNSKSYFRESFSFVWWSVGVTSFIYFIYSSIYCFSQVCSAGTESV